jgi:hypothetical protein
VIERVKKDTSKFLITESFVPCGRNLYQKSEDQMAIKEIKTYKVTCDICEFETYIEYPGTDPYGPSKHPEWKQIWWKENSPLMTGKFYDINTLDVCPACFMNENFDMNKHVPEGAFDVKLKEPK